MSSKQIKCSSLCQICGLFFPFRIIIALKPDRHCINYELAEILHEKNYACFGTPNIVQPHAQHQTLPASRCFHTVRMECSIQALLSTDISSHIWQKLNMVQGGFHALFLTSIFHLLSTFCQGFCFFSFSTFPTILGRKASRFHAAMFYKIHLVLHSQKASKIDDVEK